MSDITTYNYGGIDGKLGEFDSLVAQFTDHGDQVTTHYNKVADTSSGKSVDAGLEFNQNMAKMRQSVIELSNRVKGGVIQSVSSMQQTEATSAAHMGM